MVMKMEKPFSIFIITFLLANEYQTLTDLDVSVCPTVFGSIRHHKSTS